MVEAKKRSRVPILRVYYEITAWDRDGKITHRSGRRRSRSFVEQFIQLVLVAFQFAAETIQDTGNTARSQGVSTAILRCTGPANDETQGIVVGTDATAEAITDFNLAALIADGSGAGELLYELQTFDASVTVSAPNASFSFVRNFNNNSGGAIVIAEVGVIVAANFDFLILRDTPTSVSVPDGGGARVTYTIQVTV